MMGESAAPAPGYPVRLEVDWAERQSRWKALFRVILIVPAYLLVALLAYPLYFAIFLSWVIVLIRGRHPTWMFTFVVAQLRIVTRIYAYFFLLTDRYVVFEGEHPLSLDIDYPERTSRRQLVLWKLIASFPHFLVLQLLYAAALAISFVGWISIVFGGTYPKGLHGFATGVLRWQMRVVAYVLSLTDVFPPYSIDAAAGPGSRRSLVLSAIGGAVLLAALIGGITALVIAAPDDNITVRARYETLTTERSAEGLYAVFYSNGVGVELVNASDPADPFGGFIVADEEERLLMFELEVFNGSDDGISVQRWDFNLIDSDGSHNTPIAVTVDDHRAPRDVEEDAVATIMAVFEIGAPGAPRELKFSPGPRDRFDGQQMRTIVFEFR